MENPATARWGVRISSKDFAKLRRGFVPEMMEQRWRCFADDPDPQGFTAIHITRSWTGRKVITLKVKDDVSGAEITEITWDRGGRRDPVTEDQAKEQATNFCKNFMRCEWSA